VIWDLGNFKVKQEEPGVVNVECLMNTMKNWLWYPETCEYFWCLAAHIGDRDEETLVVGLDFANVNALHGLFT